MKTPCKNCPFIKGNFWTGGYSTNPCAESKIIAFQETARQKKFACHMKHPDRNIFSLKDMEHNDCAGYKLMLENKDSNSKHPTIVNGFNETGPEHFDLWKWFKNHSNDLTLLEII